MLPWYVDCGRFLMTHVYSVMHVKKPKSTKNPQHSLSQLVPHTYHNHNQKYSTRQPITIPHHVMINLIYRYTIVDWLESDFIFQRIKFNSWFITLHAVPRFIVFDPWRFVLVSNEMEFHNPSDCLHADLLTSTRYVYCLL